MIEIYRWDDDGEEYVFDARFNDDGTVDGTTPFAETLSNKVDGMNIDPAQHSDAIQAVLRHKYTGPLRGVKIDG